MFLININPRSNISSKKLNILGLTYDKFKRCLYFKSLLPIKSVHRLAGLKFLKV